MDDVIDPQEVAIRDWNFSQEGGKFVLRALQDEGYELKENSIYALNRSVKRLIATLNALRDEYGFKGHLRQVFVQDNPLSGPVVRYCVYHKSDGPKPRDMMMAAYNDRQLTEADERAEYERLKAKFG